MNFILALLKRAFGGPSDIDGIIAPMRKIVTKLNAHAEAAFNAADEKQEQATSLLEESKSHNEVAARAKALAGEYGKLIGG